MATYLYENSAGERREIVASMKSPPPERVVFMPDGGYAGCDPAGTDGPDHFRRVWAANLQVNSDPVTKRFPFVSNSLPRHAPPDVADTDSSGRAIVWNADHARALAARYGSTFGDHRA